MKMNPTATGRLRATRRQNVPAANPPGFAGPRIPVQTSYRHMRASPAATARIEAEVEKLGRFFDAITHCHVVVVAPHRHHRSGRRFAVHLELGVPRERLVIAHEPAARPLREAAAQAAKSDESNASRKDLNVAIRDAFVVARRRLKEYVRRLRGDVCDHRLTR